MKTIFSPIISVNLMAFFMSQKFKCTWIFTILTDNVDKFIDKAIFYRFRILNTADREKLQSKMNELFLVFVFVLVKIISQSSTHLVSTIKPFC
jgi:hypothetical protein